MSSQSLDNLVKIGQLKIEPANQLEFNGLLTSGKSRLKDAMNISLSKESKFDLAYNAAHALSLAALRRYGYRSSNRYIVFQTLPYTLGVGPEIWRIFSKCHDLRNLAEYEGYLDIDEILLSDLFAAANILVQRIESVITDHA